MSRRVSVVVPVLNATRTLPECLAALGSLRTPPSETFLVDNGSTDGSIELLRRFTETQRNAHVVVETRRGAAAARNAGIRAASGDVVAFIDADCVPEPAWLERVAAPFADPRVGAVAGRIVGAPAGSMVELFSALYTLQAGPDPAHVTRWTPWSGGFPTANLAVRRELLERLDGFDESLDISGEDYDLCARLYTAGAVIAYQPDAVVAHRHRTTVRGMVRQTFGFGRSHAVLLSRHARRGLWIDVPVRSLAWPAFPGLAWVDLAGADKKLLALLLGGLVFAPALWLLPPYAVWLTLSARARARRAGITVSIAGSTVLAALLLLKSTAMTAGRWYGSMRYGTACL